MKYLILETTGVIFQYLTTGLTTTGLTTTGLTTTGLTTGLTTYTTITTQPSTTKTPKSKCNYKEFKVWAEFMLMKFRVGSPKGWNFIEKMLADWCQACSYWWANLLP